MDGVALWGRDKKICMSHLSHVLTPGAEEGFREKSDQRCLLRSFQQWRRAGSSSQGKTKTLDNERLKDQKIANLDSEICEKGMAENA